jgi:putative peptidoglycan lipid II flippase
LAVCILVGGFAQWAVQWPALRRAGNRRDLSVNPQSDPFTNRDRLKHIYRAMLPTTIALTVTQLNTLSDSFVAWLLAAPINGPQYISWLGSVAYPMRQGAVAAIYFGERLYQFPLGLIGVATATAVFPLLSRHAARGNLTSIGNDLSRGLRLVLLASVPAAVGLVVLAEPITRLMFERGQFTATDAARTARMVAIYGSAVWAYCALPVLVRGFYALNDRLTPLRIALGAVALNIALDLTLIWPMAEAGLAAATAISAILQMAVLAILFSRKHVSLDWRLLRFAATQTIAASAAMAFVGILVLNSIPARTGNLNALLRVAIPIAACLTAYCGLIVLFRPAQFRANYASQRHS